MKAQFDLLQEKIVDSFAGGGGASVGIELATGRIVDAAINHDPDAILMHTGKASRWPGVEMRCRLHLPQPWCGPICRSGAGRQSQPWRSWKRRWQYDG